MNPPLKIAFFGTPHFVTHVLEALKEAGFLPEVVVTASEKPAGRGLLPRPSPVKVWAQENGREVWEPDVLDDAVIQKLKEGAYDVFIVAGYGKILPKELLEIPRYGTLNVHPSLLPKFRGPSPIEAQILEDAKTVGVSIILLDEETDHGPIVAQRSFTPESWPLSRSLLEKLLWSEGGKLLAESITPYVQKTLMPKEQDHAHATFTPKLSKEDGRIDLAGDAYPTYLKYLAYEGWPGTYFFAEKNGKNIRIKVTEASFENGTFTLRKVVPEAKKEMRYEDFIREGS